MDIVLRATAMFVILYLVVRLLGKRELAQLTPFELITLLVMGDLAQQGVTHSDTSITGSLLANGTFTFLGSLLGWLTYKSRKAERLLDGSPRVVIRNGQILEDALARDRMTLSEVHSQMRLAGIGKVSDVAWGIIEAQGRMSFIRKDGDEVQTEDDTGPVG